MKIYIADMILAIFLGVNNVDAQVLWGTTSQKQAIELLKSQGKLLPNVPVDYGHYGVNYSNNQYYIYNTFPY